MNIEMLCWKNTMSRLVAFGCSHTYGEGLHSIKSAWPYLLSEHYKIECVNNGVPASSNKNILFNILNFDFRDSDTVIIYWSHIERWTIFNKNNKIRHIYPSQKDDTALNYYRYIFTENDSKLMFDMIIDYANLILEKKNIKTYNFSVKPELVVEDGKASTYIIPTTSFSVIRREHLSKLDGKHMDEQGQNILANEMITYIGDDI